jgi:hypothetical protein
MKMPYETLEDEYKEWKQAGSGVWLRWVGWGSLAVVAAQTGSVWQTFVVCAALGRGLSLHPVAPAGDVRVSVDGEAARALYGEVVRDMLLELAGKAA